MCQEILGRLSSDSAPGGLRADVADAIQKLRSDICKVASMVAQILPGTSHKPKVLTEQAELLREIGTVLSSSNAETDAERMRIAKEQISAHISDATPELLVLAVRRHLKKCADEREELQLKAVSSEFDEVVEERMKRLQDFLGWQGLPSTHLQFPAVTDFVSLGAKAEHDKTREEKYDDKDRIGYFHEAPIPTRQ